MIARYVTNTHEIADTYKKILLNVKDARVKIEPSNDNNTKLVFFQKKRHPYEYSIQGDTLTVTPTKARWYNFLKIGVNHSEIKLCVPKSTLESISVRSTVGHVDICSIICNETIDIQTNTGNLNVDNTYCKVFNSNGNTGSISLNKLISTDNVRVICHTGKVLLNDCSAPKIFVKTNTGKVCGKLPANIVFVVRTNTGKIATPNPPIGETIGGTCEIITNTGNIKFE